MNEERLEIVKTENGVLLREHERIINNPNGNPIFTVERFVIEEDDIMKLIERTCKEVAEYLGYDCNPYTKENIRISFDAWGSKSE